MGRSRAKAVRLWENAAEQGDAKALFNLGNAYSDGNGVDQSQAKAVRLWQKAAAQGFSEAENKLQELGAFDLDSLQQSLRESETVVRDHRDDPGYDSDSESEYQNNLRWNN